MVKKFFVILGNDNFIYYQIDLGLNILLLNNEIIFMGKYEVEDWYNLVIKNVQFYDEGIYECDIGEQCLIVVLQVVGELIQVIKL